MSRLNDLYKAQIKNSMREKFGYKNDMEIPKLEKIVINIGVGEATENSKAVDAAASDLAAITGQQPMICKAHKSLAAWHIRVRDFRGISDQSFDGRGNYAFGVKEQLIFPEVDYEKIDRIRGMDIIVVTTAKTDEEARELLRQFGMPFKK